MQKDTNITDVITKRMEVEEEMKSEILRLLKQREGYVSGQDLCSILHVSRTAVWKAMNQLKADGYVIDSIPNRGYRLLELPDLITKEEIESEMDTNCFGREVYFEENLDSTNIQAKRLAEKEVTHGLLVLAEQQTLGKGRRGRKWVSEKGSGIWMSLILKPDISPYHASMLTLVAALAVNRAIRENTELLSYIKWPNDIVVNGKKVCGILTEMSSETDLVHYVIIGMGINVNTEHLISQVKGEELEKKATSLYIESGKKFKRSLLIKSTMKYLEYYYNEFIKTEDLSLLLEEYNKMLVNIEKKVSVQEPQTTLEGIAKGINKKGELLVQTESGQQTILSGEVSVRGIYGYV